jgi:hypothetical protein
VNVIQLQPFARLACGGKASIASGQQQGWNLVERAAILQRIAESNHDALAFAHADCIDSTCSLPRLFQGLWKRSHGVAAYSNKDGSIGALDLFGVTQGCGDVQNVQARDTHQFRAELPDDSGHAAALKAHIDDANLMSARAERRRNVFQPKRLSAKKRSKTEMSG